MKTLKIKFQKYLLPQTPKEDEDTYFIIQLKDTYHCPSCDFACKFLPIIKEHINSQHKIGEKGVTIYSKKKLIETGLGVSEEDCESIDTNISEKLSTQQEKVMPCWLKTIKIHV